MDHQEWLNNSLSDWQAAGILTADQAAAIRARHAASPAAGSDAAPVAGAANLDGGGKDRLVAVISTIGAIVVGLGVILLVAANWEGIAPGQRFVLLAAVMVSLHALGWKLRDSGGHPHVATSILLTATLVFGASIFLIGQTYNVQAHDPLAFLVLAGVATVMALIVDSRPHGGVAAAALGTWWVYEIGYLMESSDNEDGHLVLTIVAALGGLAIYAAGQALRGLVLRGEPVGRSLGDPCKVTGLLILAGSLTVLSLAHRISDDVESQSGAGYVLVSAAVAIAAALALYVARRQRHHVAEALTVAALTIALVVAALGTSAYLMALVANVGLVALALGGIALGVARRDKVLYGLGVTVAVVDIAVRYFDFLFNTLSGGLFFIGAGAVLLGIGWLISRTRQVWKEQAAT